MDAAHDRRIARPATGRWRLEPNRSAPKSDAFATGQTLYVLSLAGYTADRREINRGIDFLVATQKPDGSWPMTSRSTPDGRPGSSKLLTPINCAASSWATLGLASLVPEEKPASKSAAARTIQKIPHKGAGTYKGGKLIEMQVRGRVAYLVEPTARVDSQKRRVWDFPFWMAINDGFGKIGHRYYVERLLAAGFSVAGVDVGASYGSPAGAEVFQEFYEQLVSQHGLHKRARLLRTALADSSRMAGPFATRNVWTALPGCARRPTFAPIRRCPTSSPVRQRDSITVSRSRNSADARKSSTRSTTSLPSPGRASKSCISTATTTYSCRRTPTRWTRPTLS